MFKYFLQNIINELINDDKICKIEGSIKEFDKKIYIQGREYQEYSFELALLVDTGDWFKNTIGFTVRINSFSNDVEVERHFVGEIITFNRVPAKKISDYIVNQVIDFQNQDRQYKKVINL